MDEDERNGAEKGIHEALESLSSVFEAKWHEEEFIEAKWRDYGRLRNVTLIHWNLIVTLAQIKFCENF
jgi:hypothetical protein